jgi:hypothetical protein
VGYRGQTENCWLLIVALHLTSAAAASSDSPASSPATAPFYTNRHVPSVPWSIHVVRADLASPASRIDTVHAGGGALGLAPLSAQLATIPEAAGRPLAAINGDFYERFQAYAGDPRGLQILSGELLSAPSDTPAFWIDATGQPQAGVVTTRLEVTWPNRDKTPFVLNARRPTNAAALYTPAAGPSTHTPPGREFVLEGIPGQPWLPLRIGRSCFARIRSVRDGGNTPIAGDSMVLSIGPALARSLLQPAVGAVIELSTASSPDLRGAPTALGGGPILLRSGRRQRIVLASDEAYESTSMLERHPRAAIGWNRQFLFLVLVDGRQRGLSVGMSLKELANYLVDLGCTDAINLDGGGSATLWFDGRVRNRPCDGRERPIANGLVLLRASPGTEPAPPDSVKPPR